MASEVAMAANTETPLSTTLHLRHRRRVLVALEDFVYGTSESKESRQDDNDLTSHSCNRNRSARSGSRR